MQDTLLLRFRVDSKYAIIVNRKIKGRMEQLGYNPNDPADIEEWARDDVTWLVMNILSTEDTIYDVEVENI